MHEMVAPAPSIPDRAQRDILRDDEVHEMEVDDRAEGGSGDVEDVRSGGLGVGVALVVGVRGPLVVGALSVDKVQVLLDAGVGEVLEDGGVWWLESVLGDCACVGEGDAGTPAVAVGDAEGRAGDDDVCVVVACLSYGFVDGCSEDFGMAFIAEDSAVCLFLRSEELWRLACCWGSGEG